MIKGYGSYSQAYQKTAVTTSDQGRLIVMLYDGAIKFLGQAADKVKQGDYYEAHTNLVKGKSIVAELMASLNLEQGGEIAENLQRLYSYMFNELIEANLQKDSRRIHHVVELLKELRQGWKNIRSAGKGEAPAAKQAPSRQQGGVPGRTKSINLQG